MIKTSVRFKRVGAYFILSILFFNFHPIPVQVDLGALNSHSKIDSQDQERKFSIKDIFSNPDYSKRIAAELREGKVDTLSQLLSEALRKGWLKIEYTDFGAAIAWLIENFPLRKNEEGELIDETPYEYICTVLALYDIINHLPSTIISEHKGHLVETILPLVWEIISEGDRELTQPLVTDFIDRVTTPVARAIKESAGITPRLNQVADDITLIKTSDRSLMGPDAVILAQKQGWYEEKQGLHGEEHSFVRHHIAYGYQYAGWTLENFIEGLARALNATVPVTHPPDPAPLVSAL